MRILNRIVRLDEHGLVYEPDPRRPEILIRSTDLNGGTRVTPGDKPTSMDANAEPHDDTNPDLHPNNDDDYEHDQELTINALRVRCVAFNDTPEIHNITAYADMYDMHPRDFVMTNKKAP